MAWDSKREEEQMTKKRTKYKEGNSKRKTERRVSGKKKPRTRGK